MIALPTAVDHVRLAQLREEDPLVRRYRAFFALLDWDRVPERDPARPWPGPVPHARAAYIKALLVKICEGKAYVSHLRAFLVEHPLLAVEVGFRPVAEPSGPYGVDVETTVPGERWLRTQQQSLDDTVLSSLLAGTVTALAGEIPALGTTAAIDVKHIYAWVHHNNPKAYVAHRFDPTQQPTGDLDCRLGVKRRSNQVNPDGTKTGPAECLWGYGSGLMSATVPLYGDVVLAELTQTFNENDVTYFKTLYEKTVAALGARPTNLTGDAAFDAWSVYEACVATGGIAAVPFNARGQAPPNRTPDGIPVCATGLPMAPRGSFRHEDGYRADRFGCPLLAPRQPEQTCAHPQFAKGVGCTRVINAEAGGKMRVNLDRTSPAYRALYRQRTSAERINSQATALGIERPKVRNARSVRHLNTLIYLVINGRALQRARLINSQEAPTA